MHQRLPGGLVDGLGQAHDRMALRRMAHVPVSPADSRTEIPLNPNWPIRLQTRLAYFSGTVCTIVLDMK